MPKVLAGYLARHPDTPVDMRVANTHKLLEMLDGGEVDFALVEGYFAKKEYDYLTYMRDRFVAVCAPDYPFHGPVRTVEDLLEERLIVREAGSGTRGILEKYLEGRNLCVQDFSSRVEINNIHAGLALVQEGCGITFLYEAAAREALLQGRLCEISLEEFDLFHEFTFIWRRGSIFSDYYHKLFAAMRQACETGVG